MDTTLQMESLESLEIELYGRTYNLSPLADLHFSISQLGEAMQEQPSKYAFYASIKDQCQKLVNEWAKAVERARSKADQEIRKVGHIDGNKITEDALRRALRMHPKVKQAEDSLGEVQDLLATLTTIVRAFEVRRDMIVAASTRTNTGNFQDSDVPFPIGLKTPKNFEKAKGKGQFPGK